MRNTSLLRALLGLACAAGLATAAIAADPPTGDRSTPGTVTPSTGVTTPESSAPPRPASSPASAKQAGSLSGPAASECAALRREYAKSQACFAPYRLANGGIKPEAAGLCREVVNPAPKCGSDVAEPK